MKARNIMVSPVITIRPDAQVREAATLLLEHRISGLPVIDANNHVVGILSEGDLLRRIEVGTERRRSWWLRFLAGHERVAMEYAKTHARKVADVMTESVIAASPATSVGEIAELMEKNSVKRIPIVEDGRLVGIVSRSNLVQLLAGAQPKLEVPAFDSLIREKLLAALRAQPWSHSRQLNVTVHDGVVDVWGLTYSEAERKAIRVAAENVSGVRAVNDRLIVRHVGEWEICTA